MQVGKKGGLTAHGPGDFSFEKGESFLKLDCGDGCITLIYIHFKWLNSVICELYLSRTVTKYLAENFKPSFKKLI